MFRSPKEIRDFRNEIVVLRRTRAAKRMSLRISSLDARLTLTVPVQVSDRAAQKFVDEHQDWIRRNLPKSVTPNPVSTADSIPFMGRDLQLVGSDTKTARLDEQGTLLLVPHAPVKRIAAVRSFLKHAARDRLAAACDGYSQALGKPYSRITLRDTRSRWGSCSAQGALMFSWRLILAPNAVLDYVAAHEVAHLRHMHHGPEFWELVEELFPDHAPHRKWLRDNGTGLHAYDFDN